MYKGSVLLSHNEDSWTFKIGQYVTGYVTSCNMSVYPRSCDAPALPCNGFHFLLQNWEALHFKLGDKPIECATDCVLRPLDGASFLCNCCTRFTKVSHVTRKSLQYPTSLKAAPLLSTLKTLLVYTHL